MKKKGRNRSQNSRQICCHTNWILKCTNCSIVLAWVICAPDDNSVIAS